RAAISSCSRALLCGGGLLKTVTWVGRVAAVQADADPLGKYLAGHVDASAQLAQRVDGELLTRECQPLGTQPLPLVISRFGESGQPVHRPAFVTQQAEALARATENDLPAQQPQSAFDGFCHVTGRDHIEGLLDAGHLEAAAEFRDPLESGGLTRDL